MDRAYKPQNAAPFLADLSEHARVLPETITGVDELLPEHRAWVVAALSGLPVGPTPIRATPPTKAEAEAEAKAQAAATESDPLFLDGGELEIRWPNSFEGTARLRKGCIYYRPTQARRKARNVYLILFERRRGGPVRERKTSPNPNPKRDPDPNPNPNPNPSQTFARCESARRRGLPCAADGTACSPRSQSPTLTLSAAAAGAAPNRLRRGCG